jgi:hypothetical protein
MQPISDDDVKLRIGRDNPWWTKPDYTAPEAAFARRVYFHPFKSLGPTASILLPLSGM